MNLTVERLEFCILVLVRMSAFVATAPFFSLANIPRRVKAALSIALSVVTLLVIPAEDLEYVGVIGYAGLVLKEMAVGASLGYVASVCSYIVSFSGQMIDMEIGFSMANVLDPATRIQTTITANYYSYMVMLMMLVTNMHYYVLGAIFDSFRLVPVGKVVLHAQTYKIMVKFIADYFVIGFRIVLPVFASILLINIVLGVLVRIAPQMNMFVIGMQIKVLAGLVVLALVVGLIPKVSDFIFAEMKTMLQLMLGAFT